jgi:ubiquinone/menaquinone biosynthesis C-methylase UbiE
MTVKDRTFNPYLDEGKITRPLDEYGQVAKRIKETIRRRTENENQKILVIGPGRGRMVYDMISEFEDKIAVDSIGIENLLYEPEGLAKACKLPVEDAKAKMKTIRNGFSLGNVQALPFKEAMFDITIMDQETIQYVRNKILALEEMCRVTKPDGELFGQMKWAFVYPNADTYEERRCLREWLLEHEKDAIQFFDKDAYHLRKVEQKKRFPLMLMYADPVSNLTTTAYHSIYKSINTKGLER